MWTSVKNILGVQETEKTGRVVVRDHSAATNMSHSTLLMGRGSWSKRWALSFYSFVLSAMTLAPHLQSKVAISCNDRHNIIKQNVSIARSSSEMNLIEMYRPEGFVFLENMPN